MAEPRFLDDPAFRCLREGDLAGLERHAAGRSPIDFSDSDLRGVDLRGVDLSKVLIRGAYLRDADLRGLDLRHVDMEGCSLYHAKISGTYFPPNVRAEELALSVDYGQRHRFELAAAQRVARALGAAEHRVIKVDLASIGGSALTAAIPVPQDRSDTEIDALHARSRAHGTDIRAGGEIRVGVGERTELQGARLQAEAIRFERSALGQQGAAQGGRDSAHEGAPDDVPGELILGATVERDLAAWSATPRATACGSASRARGMNARASTPPSCTAR